MRVSHLALDDFRSWKHGVVELPEGPTVLVGANGQGKTNLVEALAYLSTFSSHRVGAEGALVRIPIDEAEAAPGGAVIRARVVASGREQVIELEIVRGKANRARINRAQVKPREILGIMRTVVFAPEDLSLVRGDPSVRRSFLDDLATQLSPIHASARSDFDRVARQRAALMKAAQASIRRGHSPDLSTLEIWDQQFAALSARITATRASIASRLEEPAARSYDDVADSPRHLRLAFDASVDRVIGTDPDNPASADLTDVEAQTQRMLAALASVRDKETERGVNLVGAHRDDLTLSLGAMPVKGYASHGESWSVALALRLGAFEMLSDDGDTPILILDDVFAELDSSRREGLAALASKAEQIIVTCDVPPVDLKGMETRIMTRIQSAMMLRIDRPDLELRRKILQRRVADSGVELGEECVEFIAESMQDNVRQLEGAIRTIITHSQFSDHGAVDLEATRRIVGGTVSIERREVTPESILDTVCSVFGVEKAQLRTPSRKAVLALPRQVTMYLVKKHTSASYNTIAQLLNRNDHTTIMHGCKAIEGRLSLEPALKERIEQVEATLFA